MHLQHNISADSRRKEGKISMKTKTRLKGIISLILCLVMVLSMVPTGVKATDPLPAIQNIKISDDGILSWDPVADATAKYWVLTGESHNLAGTQAYIDKGVYDTTKPTQCNIIKYLENWGNGDGTYTFKLCYQVGTNTSAYQYIDYIYTSDPATATPVINITSLPEGYVGTSYEEYLRNNTVSKTASGSDAYTAWSIKSGSLPAGLNLSEGGTISGTPTTAGTYTFTVEAKNSKGSTDKELTIKVNGAVIHKPESLTATAKGVCWDQTADPKTNALTETFVTCAWISDETTFNTSWTNINQNTDCTRLHSDGDFVNGNDYYVKCSYWISDSSGSIDMTELSTSNCSLTVPGFDTECYSVNINTSVSPVQVDVIFKLTCRFYNVTFVTGGYDGTPSAAGVPDVFANMNIAKDSKVTKPDTTTIDIEGNSVTGWYKNVAGTTTPSFTDANEYDFNTPVTEDITLYAKWEVHEHAYNKEVVEDRYRKAQATCESPAEYYKSCECGKSSAGTADEDTFTSGVPYGHISAEPLTASDVKASDATCTSPALYYAVCDHSTSYSKHYNPEVTVAVGDPLGHSFTTKASTEKASDATCTEPAHYYVQCDRCSEIDHTKTVAVGTALGHSFTTKASTEKASDATCTEPAHYYVQCDRCSEIDHTKTVAVGTALGHSFTTKASSEKASDATLEAAATYYVQCDHCDAVNKTKTVPVGSPLTSEPVIVIIAPVESTTPAETEATTGGTTTSEGNVVPAEGGNATGEGSTAAGESSTDISSETGKAEEISAEKPVTDAEIKEKVAEVFTESKVAVTEKNVEDAKSATKKNSAYYDENGEKITSSFIETADGTLRYIGTTGKSVKKSVVASYNASTGEMKMYYAGKNGAIVKNKVVTLTDGSKIFASKDGSLATKQVVTSGKHQYYADENGKLVTNSVVKTEDGTRYYANKYGRIRKNALFTAPDGDKRYATADGTLAKSCWVTVGKKMYWCNKIGRITKSKPVEGN